MDRTIIARSAAKRSPTLIFLRPRALRGTSGPGCSWGLQYSSGRRPYTAFSGVRGAAERPTYWYSVHASRWRTSGRFCSDAECRRDREGMRLRRWTCRVVVAEIDCHADVELIGGPGSERPGRLECGLARSIESGRARSLYSVAFSIGRLHETPQHTVIRKMMRDRREIATVIRAPREDTSRYRPVSGGAGLARSLVGGRAFLLPGMS